MLAEELHKIAAAAKATRLDAATKSFIAFVLETAKKEAMAGRFGFIIPLSSIASWNEEEMRAAFPALEEDGFKIQISKIETHALQASQSFGLFGQPTPKELKVNW